MDRHWSKRKLLCYMNCRTTNMVLYTLLLKFRAEGKYNSSRTSRELGIKTWVCKSRPNWTRAPWMLTMTKTRYVKSVLSSWVEISFPTTMALILVIGKYGLIWIVTHLRACIRSINWANSLFLTVTTSSTLELVNAVKTNDWCHKFLFYWV